VEEEEAEAAARGERRTRGRHRGWPLLLTRPTPRTVLWPWTQCCRTTGASLAAAAAEAACSSACNARSRYYARCALPARVPQLAAHLCDAHLFDPAVFRIQPGEAVLMDPQQRMLLHVSHEALFAQDTPSYRPALAWGCLWARALWTTLALSSAQAPRSFL
jgi:hypothetical protein